MTKEEFLKDVTNWNNHLYLLWEALEKTLGEVIEMGCGPGSTPHLHQYCQYSKRKLFSYENNLEWIHKMMHFSDDNHQMFHVIDWDEVSKKHIHPSVVLIDLAPGERRKIDLELFKDKASIIVCHDTEPAADHGYQMRTILKKFKWIKEYESPGAWATMVSNFVEL